MTDISPAAQAVLDAYSTEADRLDREVSDREMLAAALRAVAKHCVPDDSEGYWVYIPHVLAIADELEDV